MGAIDWTRDGYAAIVKRLVRVSILSLVALAAVVVGTGALFRDHADRLPAGRGPGRVLRRDRSCPRAPRSTAPRRWPRQAEEIMSNTPGIVGVSSIIGYNFLNSLAQSNSAFLIMTLAAVRGAPRARASGRRDPQAGPAAARRHSRAPRRSPSTCRRSSASAAPAASSISCRTSPAATSTELAAGHARPDRRGQSAARAVQRVQHVRRRLRRSSISTSTATRRRRWASQINDVFTALQGTLGGSTSTTSTCSAAPGRSTSRPTGSFARRSTTSSRSTCATPTARWCRSARSPRCAWCSGRRR